MILPGNRPLFQSREISLHTFSVMARTVFPGCFYDIFLKKGTNKLKTYEPAFSSNLQPRLSFVSQEQLDEIHFATVEVLQKTGVKVSHPEAIGLLKNAGAYVREDRAYIPEHLVKEALASAPSRVVLSDREGNRSLYLEKYRTYYGLGSDLPFTIDLWTGERRPSVLKDVVNASRLVDALPNYDFMMSFAIATDAGERFSYLHQFSAMAENTVKPVILTAKDETDLLRIFEIAAAIAGGFDELRKSPFIAVYAEPISPLVHSPAGTAKLLACAEYGIPAVYTPGMGAGMNGPCTLAGLLTQANAELLSGLVIHQLKKKGAPFIYGGCPSIADMKTSIFPYGCPEWHMDSVVLSQMARYYDLPIFSTGGCSDAITFDQQAGIELGYSLLLAQLSGANLIHDVGYLESGLTGSLESLVVCDETIGLVRRIGKGITINRESLAVEVMERVGPGGDFIADEHTFEHYRNEFWYPELLNRKRYDDWKEEGALTLGEKANAKAKKVLGEHEPLPLKSEVKEKIAEILQRPGPV